MLLYVAGPMTGLPERNRPAFFAAEALLRSMGHDTLNPAISEDLMGWDCSWEDYMKNDAKLVRSADGIVLLPGWQKSKGAKIEARMARRWNKLIFELIDGELIAMPYRGRAR